MPFILTAAATIQCAHGGRVLITPGQRCVTAGGSPVLCEPDLVGAPVVGCPQPPTPTTKPCTLVVSTFPGSSSLRVRAGGRPVYLDTLSGLTDGVPPAPVLAISAGQTTTRLEGAP
jgi:hypothetical protein